MNPELIPLPRWEDDRPMCSRKCPAYEEASEPWCKIGWRTADGWPCMPAIDRMAKALREILGKPWHEMVTANIHAIARSALPPEGI